MYVDRIWLSNAILIDKGLCRERRLYNYKSKPGLIDSYILLLVYIIQEIRVVLVQIYMYSTSVVELSVAVYSSLKRCIFQFFF